MRRIPILALVLVVWLILLYQLAVFPPVHEDEPWIASTSWQLATHGVFGSPLFAGLWGMEHRYYDFMPLYPIVSALLFRGAGVGVFQARFVSVACGILLLALTFAIGQQLWNKRVGYLASALLPILPLTVSPPYSTGALFFDTSRLARYDILVPVLGLAAFLAFLRADKTRQPILYFTAGLLAGLAGLAHLYGLFWCIALMALALAEKIERRALLLFAFGFIIPLSIYAVYVVTGWDAFRAQTAWYGDRFDLLNPLWYQANLTGEIARYRFANSWTETLTLILIGAALVNLLFAIGQKISGARRVGIPLVVLCAFLASLIESKLTNYLILVVPLLSLAFAFFLERLLGLVSNVRVRRYAFGLAALFLFLPLSRTGIALAATAEHTTPYANVAIVLRAAIPPDARAIVLHAYWFGLQDLDVRDWIVPLEWNMPHAGQVTISMFDALDRVAPDLIVIDPRMNIYLQSGGADSRPGQIYAWMSARHFQCIKEWNDVTYGRFRIYDRTALGTLNAPCPTP